MKLFAPVYILFFLAGCIFQKQAGRAFRPEGEDNSFIYDLPFEDKKKVFVIQGYETIFSHRNTKAIDFKVKKGTHVCAAREGIVIATRDDSNKRGLKDENIADGNYVFIQHDDGTIAQYWHLQQHGALVKTGEHIRRGQLIALSGNTGYSAFPHLHLEIRGTDKDGHYTSLPARFYTNKGIVYLAAGRFYRCYH